MTYQTLSDAMSATYSTGQLILIGSILALAVILPTVDAIRSWRMDREARDAADDWGD